MRVEVGDGGGLSGLGAWGLAAEVKLGFDLREGEGHGAGIAVKGEVVDPGASGVAEAKELGDFVVGFSGGVVDGAADEGIGPGAAGGGGEEEVGVAAGNDKGEGRVVSERSFWETLGKQPQVLRLRSPQRPSLRMTSF